MATENVTPTADEVIEEASKKETKHKGLLGLLEKLLQMKKALQELMGKDNMKTQIGLLEELTKSVKTVAEGIEDMANMAYLRGFMDENNCEELAKQAEELTLKLDGMDFADAEQAKEAIQLLTEFDENWLDKMRSIDRDCATLQDELKAKGLGDTAELKVYKDGDTFALGYDAETTDENGNTKKQTVVLKAYDKNLNAIDPLPAFSKDQLDEMVAGYDVVNLAKQIANGEFEADIKVDINKYADVFNKNFTEDVRCMAQPYVMAGDREDRKRDSLLYSLKGSNANLRVVCKPEPHQDCIDTIIYQKDGQNIDVFSARNGNLGTDIMLNLVNDKEFARLVACCPCFDVINEIKDMYDKQVANIKEEAGKTFGEEQSDGAVTANKVIENLEYKFNKEDMSFEVPDNEIAILHIGIGDRTISIYNCDMEGFPLHGREFVAVDKSADPMKDVTAEIQQYMAEGKKLHTIDFMVDSFHRPMDDVATSMQWFPISMQEYVDVVNENREENREIPITADEVIEKWNEKYPDEQISDLNFARVNNKNVEANTEREANRTQEAPVQTEQPVEFITTGNPTMSRNDAVLKVQEQIADTKGVFTMEVAQKDKPFVATITNTENGQSARAFTTDACTESTGQVHEIGDREVMYISTDGQRDVTNEVNAVIEQNKAMEQPKKVHTKAQEH